MFKRILSALPGIGAALLPNATCPACWPVYGGILSSLGLGFIITGAYFYLFIGLLLCISLFSLAYRARTRRGYPPFWLGLISALIILAAKYFTLSDFVFYSGASLLIIASIWNNLPLRKKTFSGLETTPACPNCKTQP